MIRYLKLYRAFFINCLVREMEFRAHFFLSNLISISWSAVFLLTYFFIFRQTSSVNGWTLEQMLLLTAIYFLADRVYDSFLEMNFEDFVNLVNTGRLDLILTKPVNSQFIVSLRRFSFSFTISSLMMFGLLVYLVVHYFWPLPLINLLVGLLIFIAGLVISYSLWFMTLLPVFWWGRVDNIQHLFRPFHQLSRIPIDITGRFIQPLFTFIFPLAFIATVPTQALTGQLNWPLIGYGVFAAALLFYLSHRLWNFALRHYTSASS
ncbi:MAG: ABC-2 family transporter protein [Patescibacteria group bacterium]